jgi:diaminopimelate epimerase
MELNFTKMQGAGNDFIMVDDLSLELELTTQQVQELCDRHFGVGADGVILVRPSARADCAAYMHYVNADGSLAEMCGNGVRCFAKYLVDNGFVQASEGHFVADTLAGPRPISFEVDKDGLLTLATVDMGEPTFDPPLIPTTLEATGSVRHVASPLTGQLDAFVEEPAAIEVPFETPVGTLRFTCVNMGNPHAVAFLDDDFTGDMQSLDPNVLGPFMEPHAVFPAKANIELAAIIANETAEKPEHNAAAGVPSADEPASRIAMRVFERGCGETLCCGTGTCATAVAAAITGRAGRKSVVKVLGGELCIEWLQNNHVLMTGPAATVFEGSVEV